MPKEFPPRVWVSNRIHRPISGGFAPDAAYVEHVDSTEYISRQEVGALVREAEARALGEAFKDLQDMFYSVENHPEWGTRIVIAMLIDKIRPRLLSQQAAQEEGK